MGRCAFHASNARRSMSSTRSCFRRVELPFNAPDVVGSSPPNRARRLHRWRPSHRRSQRRSLNRARPIEPSPRCLARARELNCSPPRKPVLRHRPARRAPGPRSSVHQFGHPLRSPPEAQRKSQARGNPIAVEKLRLLPRPSTRRSIQEARRSSARLPRPRWRRPRLPLRRWSSPQRRHWALPSRGSGTAPLERGRFSSRAGRRLSSWLLLPRARCR
jgi:hypothetical protein